MIQSKEIFIDGGNKCVAVQCSIPLERFNFDRLKEGYVTFPLHYF